MADELKSQSLYDLEYRDKTDDAWYSVRVTTDEVSRTLTAKFQTYPHCDDIIFSSGDFETEAQLDEVVTRFRPLSQQAQDHRCRSVVAGSAVCAACGIDGGDLKFYDAVVEAVDQMEHSFSSGVEECLCNFVLFWKHGPRNGQLTCARIDSICTVQPAPQLDPRISDFARMAKEKIATARGPSCGKKNDRASIGRINEYTEWGHDEDMGGEICNFDASTRTGGHYFILIDNLEKDLTSLSIQSFIYEETSVAAQTFVFPSLLHEPFAKGIILVDCEEKIQIIENFLNNPKHLITSVRGRPWVVTQRATMGNFGTSIETVDDYHHNQEHVRELQVVSSGTEIYKLAKQLKDLFMELKDHESGVCENFVWEERRVFESSFQAA